MSWPSTCVRTVTMFIAWTVPTALIATGTSASRAVATRTETAESARLDSSPTLFRAALSPPAN